MWNRFGGFEFVPPAIAIRPYGKDWQTSAIAANQARYNDLVPLVYGTAWYNPLVVFARNDGNLTRMEVLLGCGELQGVSTVLVNDVEIPLGVTGTNMTGTGWYNVPTLGTRAGGFDLNFVDSKGNPLGDAYGSMAYIVVVVPTRLSSGTSLPTVKVLVDGLKLPVYASDGTYVGDQFSKNPAWILLDILRRCGWKAAEIDIVSFAAAAAYCDEKIDALDLSGSPIKLPRFQCNLVLQNRRSGGDVVRGIRNTARLYLSYGPGGVLQLAIENTAALQQPSKPACSNSTEPLNAGWPSYEFGDGSTGFTGILRRSSGEPSVTLTARNIADTPNSFTVEFQDSLNGYQQDSYSMIDPNDIALAGQEVSTTLMALGLPNYDQAARILKFNLDKSVLGNRYIQFDTSVRAVGIRPGDLITVSYLKEGLNRQPFRVLRISPATNYRTSTITAQIHDDAWYADSNGQGNSTSGNSYPGSLGIGLPRPLMGSVLDENGDVQFGVAELATMNTDGTVETSVSVAFIPPTSAVASGPGMPLIDLVATVGSGGSLKGGQTLYYAVSGEDAAENEGVLSFIVPVKVPSDGSSVTLKGLNFAPSTSKFHVYRGNTPAALFRIASNQPLATEFPDPGLEVQLIAPADPNFDHANFYWRMEQQPELAVNLHSSITVGNSALQMGVNEYQGMVARITRGTGAGQERVVAANDATTLTIDPAWDLEPNASSYFVVADAGWHLGAQSKSSPVQFSIPNLSGEVVEITGRAANVNNVESEPLLATVTRWMIGGSGIADTGVPPAPAFGLGVGQSGGSLELTGVSFTTFTNTRTISSATLTIYYWDELLPAPPTLLAADVGTNDQVLNLTATGGAQAKNKLQIDSEVMEVTSVANGGSQYGIARGVDGSQPSPHAKGTPVYQLLTKTLIAPFPKEFFGSQYSGAWSFPISLPDVRVASAELFVTNNQGTSPVSSNCYTGVDGNGMRTLAGGQVDLTVDGIVAIESNAVPAATLSQARSVRDIFAKVEQAPVGSALTCVLNVNGTPIAMLTIPEGQYFSKAIDMITDPSVWGLVIPASEAITLDVTAVGSTYPGRRLTATIRF